MRFAPSLALVIVIAVACGDREVDQLVKVRDEVCACGSASEPLSCADAAMKNVPKKEEVRAGKRARDIARDMLDCYARYGSAARPKSDPDAEK